MEFSISLRLPEEMSRVGMVRRVSRDVLNSFGVSSQDVDDIEMVVGELVTNAICHAHDDAYSIEIAVKGNNAVVTVADYGGGFSPANVPAPGTVRPSEGEAERIGGWGIPLVTSLMDKVDFLPNEPRGTRVRAEKRLLATK